MHKCDVSDIIPNLVEMSFVSEEQMTKLPGKIFGSRNQTHNIVLLIQLFEAFGLFQI